MSNTVASTTFRRYVVSYNTPNSAKAQAMTTRAAPLEYPSLTAASVADAALGPVSVLLPLRVLVLELVRVPLLVDLVVAFAVVEPVDCVSAGVVDVGEVDVDGVDVVIAF